MTQSATRFIVLVLILFCFQQSYAQVKQTTLRQIELLLQEKKSRTAIEQKIDSRLLQAVREKAGLPMAKGIDLAPADVKADALGNLDVDIRANVSDELLVSIEKLGGKIIYPSAEYHTIRATVNLSAVKAIAAFTEVQFIEPAARAEFIGAKTNSANAKAIPAMQQEKVRRQLQEYFSAKGCAADVSVESVESVAVTSQGDRAHRADDTRAVFGYSGEGIKIGVLSNSFNAQKGAAADIASGDLPGAGNPFGNKTPVKVVQDQTSIFLNDDDEGRAMLQIVHDLVPKAQLFFATANVSEAGFADNIKKLRFTYGCDIIIDDVSYYDEPAFEDGIVAQAVNSVTANGAMYFSSAGNAGSVAKGTAGVFEGDFNDAGSAAFTGSSKNGTIHNFGTVSSPLNGDVITVQGNVYNLDWSDPLGKSANDYDLFLVKANGAVKASSTNVQSGTQNPYEQISASTLVAGDRLVVFKTTGAAKRAFRVNTNRGELQIGTVGQTRGHASAAAAFCVAAAPAYTPFGPGEAQGPYPNAYSTASKVESFSSDGPRRIFYNADTTAVTPGNFLFATSGGTTRAKPDVTAADGVSTTFPSSTGLNPFFGTSAAAPHAGAIAALLKSADPTLTPAQIRNFLTTTTLDVEATGYDNISGNGVLQAFQAMQALNPTPVANVTLDSVTTSDGVNSNHDGIIDPNESGSIVLKIKNNSKVAATAVNGTLTTSTPGVTITQGTASFGTISANGGSKKNTAKPFTFQLDSSITCSSVIDFFLSVKFSGGKSSPKVFEFTANVGAQPYENITANLGTPASGAGYTVSTGTQTGRLSRGTTSSVCGTLLANPGVLASAGLDPRRYDAYKFTNTSNVKQCVTTIMNADSGLNLYCAAYNDSGFVPADPSKHFLADPGQSALTQAYAFNIAPGKSFTIVVNEVNSGTLTGTPYSLSVSLSKCSSSGPSAMPITLSAKPEQNKQVPLQWKVLNEANVHHYILEHSTDGSYFSALRTIPATAAANNAEKTYIQPDNTPTPGNNFYRIKGVSENGKIVYSNVLSVPFSNGAGLALSPNPASTYINIASKNSMQQVQLLSPAGQVLQSIAPNARNYRIAISSLAAGQYLLRIQTEEGISYQKFIKE